MSRRSARNAWHGHKTTRSGPLFLCGILLLGVGGSAGAVDILSWPFSEASGATTEDTSGNGHTGTLRSTVQRSTDVITGGGPYSLFFNGTDAELTTPNATDLFPANNLILEADFKVVSFPSGTAFAALVGKGGYDHKTGYELVVGSNGKLVFTAWIGGQVFPNHIFSLETPVQTNKWYHSRVVWTGKDLSLWLDGTRVAGTSVSLNGTAMSGQLVTNDRALFVGRRDPINNNAAFLRGYVDNVRITTLTPQISSLNPTSGTASGGTALTIQGFNFLPGSSVTFGGTAANAINVENLNKITCTTPAHAAGSVDVVVTNPGGNSATLSGGYTYNAASGGGNSPPKIDSGPSADPASPLVNQQVSFTVSVSDPNTSDSLSISWNFGDGSTGSGATATHTYATAGSYEVVATVSDGQASASASLSLQVKSAGPTITEGPNAAPSQAKVNSLIQFSATATAAGGAQVSYAWDFGDGSPAEAGQVLNHAFATAGTYTVTLTATANSLSSSATVLVTVSDSGIETVILDKTLLSLAVKLNQAHPEKSRLTLKGTLTLPEGFAPQDLAIEADLSSVLASFVLDEKGKAATDANGSKDAQLLISPKTGKFVLKIKNRDILAAWQDKGLVTEDVETISGELGFHLNSPDTTYIGELNFEYNTRSGALKGGGSIGLN